MANVQTAGSVSIGAGMTTGTITIGGTAETGTITLGSSSGTNSVLIANGAGATTLSLANVQIAGGVNIATAMTTGNIAIGSAQTSGTLTLGSIAAGTGAVRIADGTGAQTVTLATGAGAKTLTLGSINTTSSTTINSGTGDILLTNGNVRIVTTGKGLQQKAGAATDFLGTAVLTLGAVVVANTNIATGDKIFLSRIAANGGATLGELSYTISNGASFTITSLILGTPAATQTADVSSVAYFIVRPL